MRCIFWLHRLFASIQHERTERHTSTHCSNRTQGGLNKCISLRLSESSSNKSLTSRNASTGRSSTLQFKSCGPSPKSIRASRLLELLDTSGALCSKCCRIAAHDKSFQPT